MIKSDWQINEVEEIYRLPLFRLVTSAIRMHAEYHDPFKIQICGLISVKTGGCPEDCKYCPQSSHYKTSVRDVTFLSLEEVKRKAKQFIDGGATRVCLGAAWRKVRDGNQFDAILAMVTEIAQMGTEVCCTLGTLNESQALKLKQAGLYAYNHNIDTSREFYPQIITTRPFEERLETLQNVRNAGLTVCCGGILGLGESDQDRISFLHTLCTRSPHPESVPINLLITIPGTPLENAPPVPFWEVLRAVSTARLLMPKSTIRLSAGRSSLSFEQQALCFLAGAGSLWLGEKLLTVANSPVDRDLEMFSLFGLKYATR